MLNLLEHIAENSKFYKIVLASDKTPVFTERLQKMLAINVARSLDTERGLSISRIGIQKNIAIWYASSA